jgi:protein ImuB
MYACLHNKDVSNQVNLYEIAGQFSPLIEPTTSHTVVFDVAGLDRLIGDDLQVARAIANATAKAGIHGNIALAANPNAAVCAATNIDGVTVIPPGEELDYLGDLPINELCATLIGYGFEATEEDSRRREDARRKIEIVDTLRSWGIRCFRDLAELPEPSVSERLGPEGVLLQLYARGRLSRLLIIDKPPTQFEESIELDDSIDNLEPLSFVISGLTDRLCAALASRAFAAQELRLSLMLEGNQELAYAIRLPFPSQDAKSLNKLLVLEVQTNPPKSPVISVHISAVPVIPRVTQNQLFEQAAPEPEKLELTLARIARLVGPDNIGSPAPLDTHRPDAFGLKRLVVFKNELRARPRKSQPLPGARSAPYPSYNEGTAAPRLPACAPPATCDLQSATCNLPIAQPSRQPRLALRRFRPPLPATVEQRDGLPHSVNARGQGCNLSVRGRVIRLGGPWRTSGDWWEAEPWSRDEWDAALSDGAVYRIYYDFRSTAWFIDGVYD